MALGTWTWRVVPEKKSALIIRYCIVSLQERTRNFLHSVLKHINFYFLGTRAVSERVGDVVDQGEKNVPSGNSCELITVLICS